ncbi:hypothetical protein GPALN_005565 [Globodera pallida]|nr:hypothetical protein GPALN_005565 [Globodera pallida]
MARDNDDDATTSICLLPAPDALSRWCPIFLTCRVTPRSPISRMAHPNLRDSRSDTPRGDPNTMPPTAAITFRPRVTATEADKVSSRPSSIHRLRLTSRDHCTHSLTHYA